MPPTEVNSIAVLRLNEVMDGIAVLSVPGTDYELHLVTNGGITTSLGKRIRGKILARALRMHRSNTGGNFIEPVYGRPRIVQGTVLHVDGENRRVLFDMAVPVWVTPHNGQAIDDFHPGEMWNCYLESGTSFAPVR